MNAVAALSNKSELFERLKTNPRLPLILGGAALAAAIFHRREVGIDEVKAAVRGAGHPVRD